MALQLNKERAVTSEKIYIAMVRNFTSSRSGKAIANQFIITLENGDRMFQSYKTVIALITKQGDVLLDKDWNYSVTTSRYRNKFLNEITSVTQKKIDNGTYLLTDLNSDMNKYR